MTQRVCYLMCLRHVGMSAGGGGGGGGGGGEGGEEEKECVCVTRALSPHRSRLSKRECPSQEWS